MRKQIETNHCVAFINRLAQYYPKLHEAIYHCPNESKTVQRNDIGTKPGQPDYCLPIPKDGYGSLFLEFKKPGLKTAKGGGISDAQERRMLILSEYNKCVVCYSWQEGINACLEYLHLEHEQICNI